VSLVPDGVVWRASLVSWTIRGVFCALPSFVWAVLSGYSQPFQWVEMAAGVATYVIGFAWVTALPAYRERMHESNLGWSLRVSANTRAALAPLMFYGPDMGLGMISIHVVKVSAATIAGVGASEKAPGWTYATTVVRGAPVAVTMVLLALVIWGGRVLVRTVRAKARAMGYGTS